MTGIVGAVFSFGFNFAPQDWALCNGAQMSIANNQALFALIGTTYGGNGTTTFNVPNLQGRVPIGMGQGPGLSNYVWGQSGGSETVTLTSANLPAHIHPVNSAVLQVNNATRGAVNDPTNAYFAGATNLGNVYNSTSNCVMANNPVPPATLNTGVTGNGQPFSILNQYLTVNYCICVNGIFPSRN